MSLAGRKSNPIDVNFQLQKSFEIFDNNSTDKIQFKKRQYGKSALPHANLG